MSDDSSAGGSENEFKARLAHDLRNFLAPIRNVAQVLRVRGKADPDLQAMAEMLDRQVSGIGGILNAMKESGRSSAGPLPDQPAPAPAGTSTRAVATSRRVLIVDDNAALCSSLGGVLKDLGHDTKTSGDGADALRIATTWEPDVVFLDVHMPGLSGFDVARGLRARFSPAAMKLVMMSGDTLNELSVRGAKEAGFDQCIDKLAGIAVFESILGGGDSAG